MPLSELKKTFQALSDPAAAEHSLRFFKTGPGEYGEGDRFLGIRVPAVRKEARRFLKLPLTEIEQLLASPWHEERLCALFILVDASAHKIVGPYLADRDREDLIHKAVGWMLRELGKRGLAAEEAFLAQHHQKMPRTMLRYAIEKFEPGRRKAYLQGRIQELPVLPPS